jgi:hypothetical protein
VRDRLKAHVLITMDVDLVDPAEIAADAAPVLDRRSKS